MPRLIEACRIDEKAYADYLAEWDASGERMVPAAAGRKADDFAGQVEQWNREKVKEFLDNGFVPATLYFWVDDAGRLLGAIHFRHELNAFLSQYGGHIGYGIRPTERRKGHAAAMLAEMLALLEGRTEDAPPAPCPNRILITCDDANAGSARTIERNGGVLENIVPEGGKMTRRYWITPGMRP